MKTKFQRQVRKAYLATAVAKMDALMLEERHWKRRCTIAQNKLAGVRRRLNDYAVQLAKESLSKTGVLP